MLDFFQRLRAIVFFARFVGAALLIVLSVLVILGVIRDAGQYIGGPLAEASDQFQKTAAGLDQLADHTDPLRREVSKLKNRDLVMPSIPASIDVTRDIPTGEITMAIDAAALEAWKAAKAAADAANKLNPFDKIPYPPKPQPVPTEVFETISFSIPTGPISQSFDEAFGALSGVPATLETIVESVPVAVEAKQLIEGANTLASRWIPRFAAIGLLGLLLIAAQYLQFYLNAMVRLPAEWQSLRGKRV